MVVVKQSGVAKTLMQLRISMLILIAGILLIIAAESDSLSIGVSKKGETSRYIPKSDNASPPIHFPEAEFSPNKTFVKGTPILQLGNYVNSTNQTIINNIKKKLDDIAGNAKDKLPHMMTVILNDNDTQYDTHNLNVSTDRSNVSVEASTLQTKSVKLYNNELSKRTTIIFLVSVTLVSTFLYILLVSLRKILERKYGDKELLVQNEMKQDFY